MTSFAPVPGTHGRSKLTDVQRSEIRAALRSGMAARALAEQHGVSPSAIYRLKR